MDKGEWGRMKTEEKNIELEKELKLEKEYEKKKQKDIKSD